MIVWTIEGKEHKKNNDRYRQYEKRRRIEECPHEKQNTPHANHPEYLSRCERSRHLVFNIDKLWNIEEDMQATFSFSIQKCAIRILPFNSEGV